MKTILRFIDVPLALGLLSLSVDGASAVGNETPTFNRDIRPILSSNCFSCHGFDEKERKANLRLDLVEGATRDLGGYQAIVPGDLKSSEVWSRITSEDADEIMPPPDSHRKLTARQVDTIRRWIEQGAEYEDHWSFIPPTKPAVPEVAVADNPIDAFLQARLAREGLDIAPPADRETMIRRVTLDLTGLPPTPGEVEAFVSDISPHAYDSLVDRLLNRVTYGEHMARYWLDLARYADTHGLHLDNERSMWPYRDWVVRAFNENIPFDQFTIWQLAGDLLPEPTRDQLIASGFNRCNVSTSEGGSINEEWIYRYAVDRTSTAVEVWMGLTAGCAVCHDHKFDPLTTKEFYSLYAFFHSAADPAMDGNRIDTPPILRILSPEDEALLKELDLEIADVDRQILEMVSKLELDYQDPAAAASPPPPKKTKVVWFDDGVPAGLTSSVLGEPQQFVRRGEGEVFNGELALKRSSGKKLAQDVFQGASLSVPRHGKIFVHCFLDADDPPEAIMVQFRSGSWKHRAVWGKQESIEFGEPNTTSKAHLGALPKVGEWVRLEFDIEKVGLDPGTTVDGFAFTQYSGTVTWDLLGVSSVTDPVSDPAWSWAAWKKVKQGKRNDELPEGLRQLVRGELPEKWNEEEAGNVFRFWLANAYAGGRESIDPLEALKKPIEARKSAITNRAPLTFVMADLPEPRESFVMLRGAYDKPGDKVSRGVPAFLPPLPDNPDDGEYDRLDFAKWLVNGRNPLTARVTVNRFWQQFFGTGLVRTSADFGTQGALPSHPDLLDWLAVQFVDDGWDVRRLVKRIVTSSAYRRHSRVTPELLERDPDNRLLARGPRFRLDAEVLRDQALFVSGLLVPAVGGAGVKPYQPPNIWEPVGFGSSNTRYYKQDTGGDLYRRSLYTFLKRTAPPPFMASFDGPNREQSCSVRGRSNTPLQALQLMNDVQHVEAARQFAARMLGEGGDSAADRVRWGWRAVTARYPSPEETEIVLESLERHRARYAADESAAAELIGYGESKPDESLDKATLAAYTLVANLILNLDESVNKN